MRYLVMRCIFFKLSSRNVEADGRNACCLGKLNAKRSSAARRTHFGQKYRE